MKKDYTNSFILNSLKLPIISDLETLSNKLGLSKKLIYLLSTNPEKYYKSFSIPKRDGTNRQIFSPSYSLKLVQRWILEEILEKIDVSHESMAFKKGTSIKKNAEFHRYSLYLLELDIENFFPSIKQNQVFYLFKNLGYNVFISNLLASICTYRGYLPQGGVCSPYISNLICYGLDKRLRILCSKRDVLYTRYADDLTFSCDNKQILKKIRKVIEDIVCDEGFKINNDKTRFLSPTSHKKVTGITINDSKLKASKDLKRKVRTMIHHSIVTGDYSDNSKIRGYISYINSIEVGYKNKIINYINRLVDEKDYKYFKELVEEYNNNKLYIETKSMIYEEFEVFDDQIELYGCDYFTMNEIAFQQILEERDHFLKEKGYIDKNEISINENELKSYIAITNSF